MSSAIAYRKLHLAAAMLIGVLGVPSARAQTVDKIDEDLYAPSQILVDGGGQADFAVTNCNFGSVTLGDTSLRGGLAYSDLVIVNLSSKLAVRIDSLYTDDPSFRILDTVPLTIPPSAHANVRVTFLLTKAGLYYAHGFVHGDTINTTHWDSLYVRVLPAMRVATQAGEISLGILSIMQESGRHTLILRYMPLATDSKVFVEIYSLLGERLLIRELPLRSSGEQLVSFEPGPLPNGVYMLRICDKGEWASKLFQMRN